MATSTLERPEPRRPDHCPVEDWLGFLGHRWSALILWHLQGGAKRYGELSALLPAIAPKVLTERLDGLEKRGLVARMATSSFPRGVSYSLSTAGRDLIGILDQIEIWSRQMPEGQAAGEANNSAALPA